MSKKNIGTNFGKIQVNKPPSSIFDLNSMREDVGKRIELRNQQEKPVNAGTASSNAHGSVIEEHVLEKPVTNQVMNGATSSATSTAADSATQHASTISSSRSLINNTSTTRSHANTDTDSGTGMGTDFKFADSNKVVLTKSAVRVLEYLCSRLDASSMCETVPLTYNRISKEVAISFNGAREILKRLELYGIIVSRRTINRYSLIKGNVYTLNGEILSKNKRVLLDPADTNKSQNNASSMLMFDLGEKSQHEENYRLQERAKQSFKNLDLSDWEMFKPEYFSPYFGEGKQFTTLDALQDYLDIAGAICREKDEAGNSKIRDKRAFLARMITNAQVLTPPNGFLTRKQKELELKIKSEAEIEKTMDEKLLVLRKAKERRFAKEFEVFLEEGDWLHKKQLREVSEKYYHALPDSSKTLKTKDEWSRSLCFDLCKEIFVQKNGYDNSIIKFLGDQPTKRIFGIRETVDQLGLAL